jgi:hypothetical protein
MDRTTTFIIALVYLLALLILGLLFFVRRGLLFFVPDSFGPVTVMTPAASVARVVLLSIITRSGTVTLESFTFT